MIIAIEELSSDAGRSGIYNSHSYHYLALPIRNNMRDFTVDPDIARAHTIHTDFYTNPDVFRECKEKIFSSAWQFIGNTELVNNDEDVFPFTLLEKFLDEPLLLSKDKSGSLHVCSNVC